VVTSTCIILEHELSEIQHTYALLQGNTERYRTFNFEVEWGAILKDIEMEVIIY
jgi:hypothetical protein